MKEEKRKKLFTSESVTEGHPDKLCDLISDAVLDECLKLDSNARVACEVMAGKGKIFVTGEITVNGKVDIKAIVRNVLKEVGYCNEESGISYETCEILENISKQSEDIALGVDKSLEEKQMQEEIGEGAGDQGMMFGFACDETENYMPMPIDLAHKLTRKLTEVRKNNEIQGLLPDGKAQVTVEYETVETEIVGKNGIKKIYFEEKPKRIDTIVLSTQHVEEKDLEKLREEVIKKIILKVVPNELLDENTKYYINPTGRFVIGGPMGDSGLTGRKIIVDTYGGYARHGGGAFSGKDPTKVDRAAAYMARYVAKNLVANDYAKRCEIQISYAIGIAKPVSIHIETFGSSTYTEDELLQIIEKNFDLTPRGMMKTLELKTPIYTQTTNYGHFGKEHMAWEKIIENL